LSCSLGFCVRKNALQILIPIYCKKNSIFGNAKAKKVKKNQKKVPHGCGKQKIDCKNFASQNSCHDMDVENNKKLEK